MGNFFYGFQYKHDDCQQCLVNKGGNRVEFLMSVDSIQAKVAFENNVSKRCRKLILNYVNGEEISIDFHIEPGTITLAAEKFSADPEWESQPRPLNRQYNYFFELCALGKTPEKESHACIDSMVLIEKASELLQGQL